MLYNRDTSRCSNLPEGNPTVRARTVGLEPECPRTQLRGSERVLGIPQPMYQNNQGVNGHTARAPPGVPHPSKNRTRNLGMLDPACWSMPAILLSQVVESRPSADSQEISWPLGHNYWVVMSLHRSQNSVRTALARNLTQGQRSTSHYSSAIIVPGDSPQCAASELACRHFKSQRQPLDGRRLETTMKTGMKQGMPV